jgi:serine/threonine protein kinase
MSILSVLLVVLVVLVGVLGMGLVAGVFWLLWKVLKGCFWLLGRSFGFVRRELVDTLHAGGALVSAMATLPLIAMNLAILRLPATRHYGRACLDELKGVGVGLWRVSLGNPLRFVGLGALVERVESRLPDALERAPRTRRARRATFEGYDVVGTLPSGGSGAQLFVARPKPATHKRFLSAGRTLPGEVVIKSFALEAGSTLPQIVRESRALEAASSLGLVCEHQLTNDHFYYVMPYVKGDDLERVTRALHARGTIEGLADAELRLALGYAIDLCDSLQRFHSGGLWHKDVKPTNVIVAGGRAHLVDFGLVTPLASAMTLTTHGTEYYRDPEMVRLAMQGVKVHEVDGVRFDVYSAGAVLYALLENSFPAHGSLSRLSRRAPEALRWVVQRAMAELSSRYGSAAEMRADLAALAAAPDPFALRPADLPSFRRAPDPEAAPAPAPGFAAYAPPRPEPFAPAPSKTNAEPFVPTAVSVAPRKRTRRRRLLAAAVVGAVGFTALAIANDDDGHDWRGEYDPPRRTVSARAAPRAWSSLNESERKVLDLAQGVTEDLGGDENEALRSLEGSLGEDLLAEGADESVADRLADTAETATPPAPLPAEVALPERGRVLVLDDMTTSVDARVLALLGSRLTGRGFAVVGQGPTADAAPDAAPAGIEDAAEGAADVELLAGARHALGLGRADEPETQAALQAFLDQSPALDALILVSRGEVSRSEPGGEHLYRVFVKGPILAGGAPR